MDKFGELAHLEESLFQKNFSVKLEQGLRQFEHFLTVRDDWIEAIYGFVYLVRDLHELIQSKLILSEVNSGCGQFYACGIFVLNYWNYLKRISWLWALKGFSI